MSRDTSGNYSLPSGNPVVPGTTITSNWANATLDDIANALTDSLSRSGKGAMTNPLQLPNGSQALPAMTFASDPTTGLWLPAAGFVEVGASNTPGVRFGPNGRLLFGSADRLQLDANGVRLGTPGDQVASGYLSAQPSYRNRLHNGDFRIGQRGFAFSVPNTGIFTLDRWYVETTGTGGTFGVSQVTDAPPGLRYSLRIATSAAGTPGTTGQATLLQAVEGLNMADFKWGSSEAATVAVGFWVKASLSGSYSGTIFGAGLTRSYVFPFTVTASGIWEYKIVVIPGETSGAWAISNAAGLYLGIDLGSGTNFNTSAPLTWDVGRKQRVAGNVSLIANLAATFQLAGAQLERSSVSTPFERRDYGAELAMCQRYLYRRAAETNTNERLTASGLTIASTGSQGYFQFPVTMRATPTPSYFNITNAAIYDGAGNYVVSSAAPDALGPDGCNIGFSHGAGGVTGRACHITRNGAASPGPSIEFSAEI